jgi:rhodanese-related sulfurtransferase
VSPQLAFDWWKQGDGVLVDVRSDAEREWVGFVPGAAAVPWKQWPGMKLNADFDEGMKAAVPPGKKALLFCRSGVRSIAAAQPLRPSWASRPTTSSKGSKAIPTKMPIGGSAAAGAFGPALAPAVNPGMGPPRLRK